jgi:hypothetical protein
LALFAGIAEEGARAESSVKLFNAAYDKESEGWRRFWEWRAKSKRVPTKSMIGKAVFERELVRLTLSVMLLRAVTRLWLNGMDQDYDYFADAAKEQATLSLLQLGDAPALRSRHLSDAADLKRDVDERFRARFVPICNVGIRLYNEHFPQDELPEWESG